MYPQVFTYYCAVYVAIKLLYINACYVDQQLLNYCVVIATLVLNYSPYHVYN